MTLTATPDVSDGLTPSAARIYAALNLPPGNTVAELARQAQTGKSTAANLLKQMERDGLVRRTLGGSDGNRRFPDHWYVNAMPSEDGQVSEAPGGGGESADPTGNDADDEAPALSATAQEDAAPCADNLPDSRTDEQDSAEVSAPEPQAAPVAALEEAPPNGRLGQGGLRALVHGFLAGHAGTAHSPTRISRHLGRSSGAVANALVTLVNLGQAEMVTAKPRTYRLMASATQSK